MMIWTWESLYLSYDSFVNERMNNEKGKNIMILSFLIGSMKKFNVLQIFLYSIEISIFKTASDDDW